MGGGEAGSAVRVYAIFLLNNESCSNERGSFLNKPLNKRYYLKNGDDFYYGIYGNKVWKEISKRGFMLYTSSLSISGSISIRGYVEGYNAGYDRRGD